MEKQNVFFKQLQPEQAAEVQAYVDTVLRSGSPVNPIALAEDGALVGKWKLEFSTESRYSVLPPGVDVFNYIYEAGRQGRLDNVLRFNNSPVVKSLRVTADYEVQSDSRITFLFKEIFAEIFGCRLPLPFFGGGDGFVSVDYFDGTFWIERFEDYKQDGTS
ncbi:unnamed protein product [Chrysoparadoxa australica]